MMAFCYLATTTAAIRSRRSANGARWEALAVGACALRMACKESMVTAPVMVIA
jgi:hypothetical protein